MTAMMMGMSILKARELGKISGGSQYNTLPAMVDVYNRIPTITKAKKKEQVTKYPVISTMACYVYSIEN
ncbi:hypothetical protein [Butyrivibrio sp. VCB2006]|uniref:hypothetical protein n=1 Tax=Butyrivibrio sp. VCB2006 TaxID=1280679 RepID=UPI0003FC0161|nr:hypothetical protein [Butyrivibrio sp. VCB2006]